MTNLTKLCKLSSVFHLETEIMLRAEGLKNEVNLQVERGGSMQISIVSILTLVLD